MNTQNTKIILKNRPDPEINESLFEKVTSKFLEFGSENLLLTLDEF